MSDTAAIDPSVPPSGTGCVECLESGGWWLANAELIRGADGMLAVLDGPDVDSGTASEIGFASALGKPIVGLRTDLRPAGDNDGVIVNLQVEYFVRVTGGPIVTGLADAVHALGRLLGI